MQIDGATRQTTTPNTERDERISSAGLGAEVGTAADGQAKAEGPRQMDAVDSLTGEITTP